MTELQWLRCDDPAEMVRFFGERITDEQRRFFVAAIEHAWSKGTNDGKLSYTPRFDGDVEECLRIHDMREQQPLWAEILRDIIGNPFRPIMKRISGENPVYSHPTDGYIYYDNENFPPNSIRFDPAWLQWNNNAISHMIAEMMEEECGECEGGGLRYGEFGPGSSGPRKCKACKGKGRIPHAEPQWYMMPIIADAMEEAGCRDEAILSHLRGWEVCLWCEGLGVEISAPKTLVDCSHCNGTGRRAVRHWRGCWAVELLKGRE